VFSRKRAKVLFGGAGFGGKSYHARSLSVEINGRLREEGFPGQWGILFCKVGEDLKKRHLSKLEEEFGSIGRITDDRRRGLCFRFNDATMGGFYLNHLEDADRLRSAEFAWAICDELTECTRDDFGRVLYSIRSSKQLPWLPFIGASNPDGPGHAWVRKLWIDRDFRAEDGEFDQDDFLYIPALPTDNPTWTDDMAASQFAGLSQYVRIARLTGSWDVIGNARYPSFDRKFHVYNLRETFPNGIPSHWRKYRAVDYGFGVPFCCLWAAMDGEGNFWVYRELYEKGVYAWDQAQRIKEYTSDGEKIELTYAGKDFWSNFPGHQGRTNLCAAKYYMDAGIPLTEANNERIAGWVTLENYVDPNNGMPNVFISDECQNLVRTLASLPLDTRSPILEKKGDTHPEAEDHAPEALRYLLHTYHHPSPTKMSLPGADATQEEINEFRKYSDNELARHIKKQTDRSFRDSVLKKAPRSSRRGSWLGR
jgi:phage terminase large subunit